MLTLGKAMRGRARNWVFATGLAIVASLVGTSAANAQNFGFYVGSGYGGFGPGYGGFGPGVAAHGIGGPIGYGYSAHRVSGLYGYGYPAVGFVPPPTVVRYRAYYGPPRGAYYAPVPYHAPYHGHHRHRHCD